MTMTPKELIAVLDNQHHLTPEEIEEIKAALDDLDRIRSVTIEGVAEIESRHAETAAKIAEARRVFAETADCRTQEEGKQNSIAYQTAYWADSEAHRDRATLLDLVRRCEADRAHLYTECCDAVETSARHLRDLHDARAEIERLRQDMWQQRVEFGKVLDGEDAFQRRLGAHSGMLSRQVEGLQKDCDALAEGVRLYRMESPPFAQPMQIKEWERAHGHLADRDAKFENITEGGDARALRSSPSGHVTSPPVGTAGGDARPIGTCVFCGGEELGTDTHARACCDRKREAGR